MIMISVIVMV